MPRQELWVNLLDHWIVLEWDCGSPALGEGARASWVLFNTARTVYFLR